MTHDITFCADTVGCPYRFSCRRNPDNTTFESNEQVSMCEFKHTELNCDYFLESN